MIFFVTTKRQGKDRHACQRILHKLLAPVIHKGRVKALTEVVLSAICTKELVLTKLGRAIDTGIQEQSDIQKVNRLLGNSHLLKEKKVISQAVEILRVRPSLLIFELKRALS